MSTAAEVAGLLHSVRAYLEELQESGVDGLPSACPVPSVVAAFPATPPETVTDRTERETLTAILSDLEECRRCQLATNRTSIVFGTGNPQARLLFVGEAPGRDEDLQGEPFVGEAGQLLTKVIEAMQLARGDVYICNVLKCRPPGNRNPEPAEIEQCHPFLLRQVEAIGPEVIVALGTFAVQTLLRTREPISKLRGRFHDFHGIPLMPTFHPAFLLRTPAMKREVWEDMQKVMKRLGIEPARKRRE